MDPATPRLAAWRLRAMRWAANPPKQNHYTVLGVEPNDGPAELRKAFRQAALRWHPDKNRTGLGGPVGAEHAFAAAREALDVLSDAKRRGAFDGLWRDPSAAAEQRQQPAAHTAWQPWQRRAAQSRPGPRQWQQQSLFAFRGLPGYRPWAGLCT
mmetsp:Transcript_169290/g.537741  ORF Transcript_169290/g.537741 Transcript_169290/m.537741 type:complete len:154 (+) Transcript_169290:504-965(+)